MNFDHSLVAVPDKDACPEKDRRLNYRALTALQTMHSGKDGYFVEDEVVDISRSGCSMRTTEELQLGDLVEMILTFPETLEEVTVQGEVVHCKHLEDSVLELREPKDTLHNFSMAEENSHRPFYQMGMYFSFVEPVHKPALESFIGNLLRGRGLKRDQLVPKIPRIRIEFEGPEGVVQTHQLQHISSRGLFIEVDYPMSIFSRPKVRLVNPLSGESYDLVGEIMQTQVMGLKDDSKSGSYGLAIRFPQYSAKDHRVVQELLACLDTPKSSFVRHPSIFDQGEFHPKSPKTPIC